VPFVALCEEGADSKLQEIMANVSSGSLDGEREASAVSLPGLSMAYGYVSDAGGGQGVSCVTAQGDGS
jgi:hypothetical protein